jgi:hypothetical protein
LGLHAVDPEGDEKREEDNRGHARTEAQLVEDVRRAGDELAVVGFSGFYFTRWTSAQRTRPQPASAKVAGNPMPAPAADR